MNLSSLRLKMRYERVEHVNALIKMIGNHGRRFFFRDGRYAYMDVDITGKVWIMDENSCQRIYTHNERKWKGFMHGGTLRSLVEDFRDYILRGERIHLDVICPERTASEDGNIWGYPDDEAKKLRLACKDLPIFVNDVDIEQGASWSMPDDLAVPGYLGLQVLRECIAMQLRARELELELPIVAMKRPGVITFLKENREMENLVEFLQTGHVQFSSEINAHQHKALKAGFNMWLSLIRYSRIKNGGLKNDKIIERGTTKELN